MTDGTGKLLWAVSIIMHPPHGRDGEYESTRSVVIHDIPWVLSNENLLTNGVVIWPAQARSMAMALGRNTSEQDAAFRALQYIEGMLPQVQQLRLRT